MKDSTHIAVIIDRSGSMEQIMSDVIGGFNKFVEEQKALPGEATLTLVIFDDAYDVLHDFIDIKDVPPLTSDVCYARRWTALLDAVGVTIKTVGAKLSSMPEDERPSKVLVSIYTDGAENKSKEFSQDQIKEMIKIQREKHSWEFTFTGVGIESFAQAQAAGMGIDPDLVAQVDRTSKGAVRSMNLCSQGAASYRGGGAVGLRDAYSKDRNGN